MQLEPQTRLTVDGVFGHQIPIEGQDIVSTVRPGTGESESQRLLWGEPQRMGVHWGKEDVGLVLLGEVALELTE